MNAVLQLLSGLALLILGAEAIVRGASQLARALGVKPLVLGLTVVAVGTSTPELAVGITASLQGSGSLAVGNIAGTNIFNILFILGLSALLKPLPLQRQLLRLELPVTLAAAGLMTALAWDGHLDRADGAVLFGTSIFYVFALVRLSGRSTGEATGKLPPGQGGETGGSRLNHGLLLTAGMALSVLGAHWLVEGAVSLARGLGVSEAMIGLTIVAVGTSSPELVTTIVATLRQERDVAVGNLIGSSIFNILVILGLTCLVAPAGVPVESQLLWVDIPLMGGVMLACVPVFITGKCVSRLEGGLFMAIYVSYMASLVLLRT